MSRALTTSHVKLPAVTAGTAVFERDAELHDRIVRFLHDRGLVSLEVTVTDGAVSLSGHLTSARERQAAVLLVRRFAGVTRLVDQIRIVPPGWKAGLVTQRGERLAGSRGGRVRGWLDGVPRTVWLLVLLVPISMASCGGPSDKQVAVRPVSGQVTYEGKPAVGAQVVFHPQGHKLPENTVPTGRADESGQFKIGLYQSADGAPPGDYVVTVVWNKSVTTGGGSGPGPNVLPKTYASAETSPIKVTVKDGENQLPAIEIKRK